MNKLFKTFALCISLCLFINACSNIDAVSGATDYNKVKEIRGYDH